MRSSYILCVCVHHPFFRRSSSVPGHSLSVFCAFIVHLLSVLQAFPACTCVYCMFSARFALPFVLNKNRTGTFMTTTILTASSSMHKWGFASVHENLLYARNGSSGMIWILWQIVKPELLTFWTSLLFCLFTFELSCTLLIMKPSTFYLFYALHASWCIYISRSTVVLLG